MTLASDTQRRFSEIDQQELAEYRPLSRFALIAFLLGWIALMALIHPVLCLLPLLGIITALFALRQLAAGESKQSGRSLALIGLFLSVLFGSWAIARESSRELRLYGQARQFAENWLALLREGRLHELHQLTLKEGMRAAPGVSLEKHYLTSSKSKTERMRAAKEGGKSLEEPDQMLDMMQATPQEAFDTFFGEPLLKRLRNLGDKAHYEFAENVQIQTSGVTNETVELIFVVSAQSGGSSNSFRIKIVLEREAQVGVADWNVIRIMEL